MIAIRVLGLALLTEILLCSGVSEEESTAQTRVPQDVCVSFKPSSLHVDQVKSGYRVKTEGAEIPITFANSNQARALLQEGFQHAGVCWTKSVEDDLKGGFDVYLIWLSSPFPRFENPIVPLLTNRGAPPSLYRFGTKCEMHSDYRYVQHNEFGPAYLRDSNSTLLVFNSKEKAQRAYSDLNSGSQVPMLCKLSVTAATGNEAHPVVAYRVD